MSDRDRFTRPGQFGNTGSHGSSGGAMDQAKEKAGEVTDQVKETTGQLTEQLKEQATSQLAGQKERAAGSLGSVAQALRQTGDSLRTQDQPMVADYATRAADRVEEFSRMIRDKDVEEILGEVEGMARRQPALFIGGALILGMLGGRFLRASSERREATHGYGTRAVSTFGQTPTPFEPYRRGNREGITSGYGIRQGTTGGTSYGTASGTGGYGTRTGGGDYGRTGSGYRSGIGGTDTTRSESDYETPITESSITKEAESSTDKGLEIRRNTGS